MCSIFEIKINSKNLENLFGHTLKPCFDINSEIYPGSKSFIFIRNEKDIIVQESFYGLSPSWATKKIKFATYNARIETIFEKPSWSHPIRFKRCLVPLTAFFESIHEKKYAGNLVKFSKSSNTPLIAAGIWDSWVNPETKKSSSGFAIITRDPLAFIGEAGHDRSPIFLHEEYFSEWIDPKNNGNEKNILSILKSQKDDIEFKAEIIRELKGYNKNQMKLF